MTCTVSGNMIDLREQPKARVIITFTPAITTLSRSGTRTLLPAKASTQTDASGDFSVSLLPGEYVVSAGDASVQIVVPDTAAANLADIMNLTPAASLTDAQQVEASAQIYAGEAYASSLLTAADRVATGQDTTATAADRVATGQDATATAADRVATGQDATATAADRIATGQDAASARSSSTPSQSGSRTTSTCWP